MSHTDRCFEWFELLRPGCEIEERVIYSSNPRLDDEMTGIKCTFALVSIIMGYGKNELKHG